MTDHPGTLARESFGAAGRGDGGLAAAGAAAAATSRVPQACVVARAARFVSRSFVGAHGMARAIVHQRQTRRCGEYARRSCVAMRAGRRLVTFGQAANGIEATTAGAGVVVGRHERNFRERSKIRR